MLFPGSRGRRIFQTGDDMEFMVPDVAELSQSYIEILGGSCYYGEERPQRQQMEEFTLE